MKIILEGVVGSTAYGLANADSDVDLRGVFLYPTEQILSLSKGAETIDRTEPDVTHHEVEKFVRLAANGNPNILEMFWLTSYTQLTEEGQLLLDIREAFISQRVRKTYGGYAIAQMKRLQERGDGSFKSKLRKRRAKHARHCVRLLMQGYEILTTGNLTVDISEHRDFLYALGEESDEVLIATANYFKEAMDLVQSDLPETPNYELINATLLKIRKMNLS